MCGIIGYVGKKDKNLHVLIEGLKNLEYRGYDSAGIAYYTDSINILRAKGKIVNLENKVDYNTLSNIGIGHTRWATHGIPSEENAHPHRVGKITLVHNGIIENYLDLKHELINIGYKFNSETDTEVASAYINYLYKKENDLLKALIICQEKLIGSYAFAIMCEDDLDTIYLTKKDSPLVIGIGNDCNYIGSDIKAFSNHTNKYMILDDYDIATVTKDSIKVLNKGLLIDKKINIFDEVLDINSKGKYEHFMLKEINEQPIVLEKTLNYLIDNNPESLINNMPDFSKYKKIEIVGCGSAYHAGLIGKVLLEEYSNIEVNVNIASEYRYKKVFLDSNTLVIIISQSGETADSLASLRMIKDQGIDTLAIVNVVESSIAREAKYVLFTKAGAEIAVATTKAYSAQVFILSLIAMNIAYTKNLISLSELKELLNEFDSLSKNIYNLINMDYQDISNKISKQKDIFFLGRKLDYALAMEGSLKLKEISYIHSEAYPAGELKHGTISLIEEGTIVIAVITDNEIAKKTISNIKEVKARGAYVLLIASEGIIDNNDFYDELIILPRVNKYFIANEAVIPMQLISYYVAKNLEYDIDKPKNLAKSVTVE